MKKLFIILCIMTFSLYGQSKDTTLSLFTPYGITLTSELIKKYPNRNYLDLLMTSTQFSFWGGSYKGSKMTEISNQINGIPSISMFDLPYEAISKIEAFDGAYPAQYSFMSTNIINNFLNRGNGKFNIYAGYETDNILLKSGKDLFNRKIFDSYWFGYNNLTLNLSGSVGSNLNYYFVFNQKYTHDKEPKAYPGIEMYNLEVNKRLYPNPGVKDTIDIRYPAGPRLTASDLTNTFIGNINYKLTDNTLLNFFGIYQGSRFYEPSGLKDIFCLDTSPLTTKNQFLAGINLNWKISENINYTLSTGYSYQLNKTNDGILQDNITGYAGNYEDYFLIYNSIWLDGSRFRRTDSYYKKEVELFSLNNNLSYNISKTSNVRIGLIIQKYTYRELEIPNINTYSITINNLLSAGRSPELNRRNYLAGIIGYDNFGNKTDDDGVFGKREPLVLNLYSQFTEEFEKGLVTFGLRYNYFDPDNYTTIDENNPLNSFDMSGILFTNKIKKTDKFSLITPHLNTQYYISDKTKLFANFGINCQIPNLDHLYTDLFFYLINHDVMRYQTASRFQLTIQPMKNTMFELGMAHKLSNVINLNVKGFFKRITNIPTIGSNMQNNFSFDTDGKTNVAGANFNLFLSDYQNLSGSFDIAYTYSKGVSVNNASTSGYSAYNIGDNYIIDEFNDNELENLSRFSGKLFLNYKLTSASEIFNGLNFSLYCFFNSGHVYHRSTSYLFNGEYLPYYYQIDLMVNRSFPVAGTGGLELYLYAINVFNIRNIINVYPYSGNATDDGTNWDGMYNYVRTNYGENAAKIFNSLSQQMKNQQAEANYGPPRQIRLGMKLSF